MIPEEEGSDEFSVRSQSPRAANAAAPPPAERTSRFGWLTGAKGKNAAASKNAAAADSNRAQSPTPPSPSPRTRRSVALDGSGSGKRRIDGSSRAGSAGT